jgi:hypothetical protein
MDQGFGIQHRVNSEQLEEMYRKHLYKSGDLWNACPLLKTYTEEIYGPKKNLAPQDFGIV